VRGLTPAAMTLMPSSQSSRRPCASVPTLDEHGPADDGHAAVARHRPMAGALCADTSPSSPWQTCRIASTISLSSSRRAGRRCTRRGLAKISSSRYGGRTAQCAVLSRGLERVLRALVQQLHHLAVRSRRSSRVLPIRSLASSVLWLATVQRPTPHSISAEACS